MPEPSIRTKAHNRGWLVEGPVMNPAVVWSPFERRLVSCH